MVSLIAALFEPWFATVPLAVALIVGTEAAVRRWTR